MAEIQFSNKAIEDLSDIWNYTYDTWSEKQADFCYNMLIGLCYEVADKPSIGRSYAIVSEGLYGIVAGKHIIFYQHISDKLIEVVRILHGSMDIRNRIKE